MTTISAPHLLATLKVMSRDNYGIHDSAQGNYAGCLKTMTPSQIEILETQAARLSTKEKEIVAAGEDTDQRRVVKNKNVQMLDDFLASIFDGP